MQKQNIQFYKIRKVDRTAYLFVPTETSKWNTPTVEHPYNWVDDATGKVCFPDKDHPFVVAEGMYFEHRKAVSEYDLLHEFGVILSEEEKKKLLEPEGKYGIHIAHITAKGDNAQRYGVRIPESIKTVKWFGQTIEVNNNRDNGLGDYLIVEGKEEHGAVKFNLDSPILVRGKDFHFSYTKLFPETTSSSKELGIKIEF